MAVVLGGGVDECGELFGGEEPGFVLVDALSGESDAADGVAGDVAFLDRSASEQDSMCMVFLIVFGLSPLASRPLTMVAMWARVMTAAGVVEPGEVAAVHGAVVVAGARGDAGELLDVGLEPGAEREGGLRGGLALAGPSHSKSCCWSTAVEGRGETDGILPQPEGLGGVDAVARNLIW